MCTLAEVTHEHMLVSKNFKGTLPSHQSNHSKFVAAIQANFLSVWGFLTQYNISSCLGTPNEAKPVHLITWKGHGDWGFLTQYDLSSRCITRMVGAQVVLGEVSPIAKAFPRDMMHRLSHVGGTEALAGEPGEEASTGQASLPFAMNMDCVLGLERVADHSYEVAAGRVAVAHPLKLRRL